MKAIIMAGGKGTRLYNADNPMPKVLREANGKPLLGHVLASVDYISPSDITVIVGFMHEMVIDAFKDHGCHFVRQGDKAYGTGYAVMCAMESESLRDYHGTVMILSGDAPMAKRSTISAMQKLHEESGNACTMLSCVSSRALPFGRIIRENGKVAAIVEDKDCTPEQKLVREMNAGLYIFDADLLRESLSKIGNNNSQHEYYLTDVPLLLLNAGAKVDAYVSSDETELLGVNTPEDLALVEKILAERE